MARQSTAGWLTACVTHARHKSDPWEEEAESLAWVEGSHPSRTPTCSFPGEKARSWGALGEARPGQSSLSAGALRYRAWAQSWSSAALLSW